MRLEETTPFSAKAEDTPPGEGNVRFIFWRVRLRSTVCFVVSRCSTPRNDGVFEWVWLIFFFEISDEVVAQQREEFGGVGFSAFNFCNGVVVIAQIDTEGVFKTFYCFRE